MTTPSNPESTPKLNKDEKRLAKNERRRLERLAHKGDTEWHALENERRRQWRLEHRDDPKYRERRNRAERDRNRRLRKDQEFRLSANEKSRQWRHDHPESRKATAKKYRESHRQQRSLYARDRYHKNKEQAQERNRAEHEKRYKSLSPRERRAYGLRRNYGMTIDQWDTLFESQGKVCAICGKNVPGGRGHWHTDHDHETKEVRGILCNMCNVMLGHCSDSIARLESAIAYLQNPPYGKLKGAK